MDAETADAELWWEWNQRHLPLQAAQFLNFFFGTFGAHRFQTGQPLIGCLLLVFYGTGAAAANVVDPNWLYVALAVYIYEWVTLKKRTKRYNKKIWLSLVDKWHPETNLKQPSGT